MIRDRYLVCKEVGVGTFGRVLECIDCSALARHTTRRDRAHTHSHTHARDKSSRDDGNDRRSGGDDDAESDRECSAMKEKCKVAVKVVRRIRKYTESARIEADILTDVLKTRQVPVIAPLRSYTRTHANAGEEKEEEDDADASCGSTDSGSGVSGRTYFVDLLDRFAFKGHYCIVCERLGPSLYDLTKRNDYKSFPFRHVVCFTRQMLEAVAFLRAMKLIHTDLKPENVLAQCVDTVKRKNDLGEWVYVPSTLKIKVIDFGGATYDDEHKSSIVNTRQYRAPEVILKRGWSYPSDIWSVACIAAELYTGELLFATHSNTEHIALMEKCLGPFPSSLVNPSPVRERYFDYEGYARVSKLEQDSQRYVRQMRRLEEIISDPNHRDFCELLRSMFHFDPKKRTSAADALTRSSLFDRGVFDDAE